MGSSLVEHCPLDVEHATGKHGVGEVTSIVIAHVCERTGCSGNARLIAAAPDLLDALEQAVSCLEVECHPSRGEEARWRAAIAKARGAV